MEWNDCLRAWDIECLITIFEISAEEAKFMDLSKGLFRNIL